MSGNNNNLTIEEYSDLQMAVSHYIVCSNTEIDVRRMIRLESKLVKIQEVIYIGEK